MNDDKEALINIALHSVAALERMDALQGISDEDMDVQRAALQKLMEQGPDLLPPCGVSAIAGTE